MNNNVLNNKIIEETNVDELQSSNNYSQSKIIVSQTTFSIVVPTKDNNQLEINLKNGLTNDEINEIIRKLIKRNELELFPIDFFKISLKCENYAKIKLKLND